jgi:hypothetical protein
MSGWQHQWRAPQPPPGCVETPDDGQWHASAR